MYYTISLVMFCMILNTAAQLLLKETMNRIGAFSFSFHNIIPIGSKVLFNPFFIPALCCYILSMIVWLLVLSRLEVSVAYPLTSIAFIFTAVFAAIFLGENFTMVRLTGIVVIIVGIYLLTRT